MFELKIPSEVWGTIIVIALFTIYPRLFKSKIPKGELRTRKLLTVLGVFALYFASLLLYESIYGRFSEDEDMLAFYIMLVVIYATAIFLICEGLFVKGRFDEDRIEFFSPWSGKKEIKWKTLKRVNYGWFSGCQILISDNGEKIKLSTFLLGYDELVNKVQSLGFEVIS